MRTTIFVTAQFVALHAWPNCQIVEVEFLRHPHRHVFHVRVEFKVNHVDRDLEFFVMQRRLQDILHGFPYDLGSRSCEMLCVEIHDAWEWTGQRYIASVTVSEDGENGATVYWD